MNLVFYWFQNNLDIVFFIYGLAFVVMGIAIWVQPRKESGFKLADILWFLSGFGIVHGGNEWLDMWAIIKGRNAPLDVIRWLALVISYFFLFEFGRRLCGISGVKYPLWQKKIARLMIWWLVPLIGLTIFIFISAADFWKIETIWIRYLLGLPGGMFTALSFFTYYRCEKEILGQLKVKRYFVWAGISFLVYAILGGLVVPKGNFFPSNWLNTDSFLSVVKIPVQAFRAVFAVIIAWSIARILVIFNWEAREKLKTEITEHKKVEEELRIAYEKLKNTQAQLVQAAKMAAVGQLASGLAHEINNPLTGVLNNVQLVKTELEQKKHYTVSQLQEILDVVEESALRCRKIIRSLLDFSRTSRGPFQLVALNDAIEKTLILIGHEAKAEKITIEANFQVDLPNILGDTQLLQQAIFDIIANARWAIAQAGKDGGKIAIKTEYAPQIRAVVVSISDTGIGIPKENLDKIFEPFFTTKPVGQGTGLGLSIAYGIIKEHKGEISVESEINKGTTLRMVLPVH